MKSHRARLRERTEDTGSRIAALERIIADLEQALAQKMVELEKAETALARVETKPKKQKGGD